MKILQRYILREHVGPLLFALATLTSLLLLNQVAKQFGNLVGKGLAWGVIGEFFMLSIPFIIAMTLPMAVLVSTLYAFSRLAAENEITALKASGVGLWRIIRPVLWGSAVIALLMLAFNDQVLPRSNHRLRTLQGDIGRTKPTFALREQVINEVSPGKLFLRAGHIDEASDRMREITIYDLSNATRRRTVHADSGRMALAANMQDLELTLYDGYSQEIPRDNQAELQRLYYNVDVIRVRGIANSFDRTREDTYKSDREMSICEMQQVVGDARKSAAVARRELADALERAALRAATGVVRAPARPDSSVAVRSLGEAYCRWILPNIGVKPASAAAVPPQAQSQRPVQQAPRTVQKQATPAAQRGDTARARPTGVLPPSLRGRFGQAVRARGARSLGDSARPALGPADSARNPATAARDTATGLRPRPSSAALPADGFSPNFPASYAPSAGMPTPVLDAQLVPAALRAQIDAYTSRLDQAREDANQYEVEIQKKFALAAACIVFVLLGAPIALRFPRGGVGLVIGVSLGVFALYYIGLIGGETLADKVILSPFWAMWMPNLIFTITGIFFLHRVRTSGSTARGGDFGEMLDAVRASLAQVGRRVGLRMERRRRVVAS